MKYMCGNDHVVPAKTIGGSRLAAAREKVLHLVAHARVWWPFYLVLSAALSVLILGATSWIWLPGHSSAWANFVRTLQWETLSAGLFGLAGGVAVIGITREQMNEQRRTAVLVDLYDLDVYTAEIAEVIAKSEKAMGEFLAEEGELSGFELRRFNQKLINLRLPLPEELRNRLWDQDNLPYELKLSVKDAWDRTTDLLKVQLEQQFGAEIDLNALDREKKQFDERKAAALELLKKLREKRDRFASGLLIR